MFVFIVSVLLYLYLSVSLFACLYITILSVLPEWRINFIIKRRTPAPQHRAVCQRNQTCPIGWLARQL